MGCRIGGDGPRSECHLSQFPWNGSNPWNIPLQQWSSWTVHRHYNGKCEADGYDLRVLLQRHCQWKRRRLFPTAVYLGRVPKLDHLTSGRSRQLTSCVFCLKKARMELHAEVCMAVMVTKHRECRESHTHISSVIRLFLLERSCECFSFLRADSTAPTMAWSLTNLQSW